MHARLYSSRSTVAAALHRAKRARADNENRVLFVAVVVVADGELSEDLIGRWEACEVKSRALESESILSSALISLPHFQLHSPRFFSRSGL